MAVHRIMIIDDEKNVLNALRRALTSCDMEVEVFHDANEALRRAHVANFDLFLSDYRMPGLDGVALLTQIRALQPESVRMIISAYADFDAVVQGINMAGIDRFVSKPWHDYELKASIRGALEKRDLHVENRRLAEALRRVQAEMDRQRLELLRLERENPGLTQVNWGKDGSILLDERDGLEKGKS